MGLFQKALQTFDFKDELGKVGKYEDDYPLAPIGHNTVHPDVEVQIDIDGNFIRANKIEKIERNDGKSKKEKEMIIIPVTEESAGRSGTKPKAHPLCEQLKYLGLDDSENGKRKKDEYIEQLSDWVKFSNNNPKLSAVLKYVKGNTIKYDLKEYKDGDLACWRVMGLDEENDSAVWNDRELQESFISYYLNKKGKSTSLLSMISGKEDIPAEQHLKGVYRSEGNAKLISSNNENCFIGRFIEKDEALSVGYIDSQKTHNVLKWLISNQGIKISDRVLICWNPQGRKVPSPELPIFKFNSKNNDVYPTNYKDELESIIKGFKNEFSDNQDGVVIASFGAASNGRLSVTYYNELSISEFLDNLKYWDEHCCFIHENHGVKFPSINKIVEFALGTERNGEIVVDEEKVFSSIYQRLIVCRIEKSSFPEDIFKIIVNKVNYLRKYNKSNRNTILHVACSVIRKYKFDKYKEEWEMELKPDKEDRSYQFGRLLAVLEKVEQDTFDKKESRDSNAIRRQSIFVNRPGETSEQLIKHIKNAYYPRLSTNSRVGYEKLIGEIMEMISRCGGTDKFNEPLSELYILGYYLEKNKLYQKDEEKKEDE